jgi:hypothetical protein
MSERRSAGVVRGWNPLVTVYFDLVFRFSETTGDERF